jgi:eukaryotic-like serine/threonine-protein kinase
VVSGSYEAVGLLGSGGMGLVYEAWHVESGTKVALKVLRPELSWDHDLVDRFVEEGRCLAALSSEHVVGLLDAGRLATGLPYLAMERLFGTSLLELLEGGEPFSVARAVDCALEICAGLADIHAAGLVHLDVKPGNLFVVPRDPLLPRVVILDFGIARRIGDAPGGQGLTSGRRLIGSPRYSSPEQIDERTDIDRRSDIWSLGVVLFEMLSGRPPFVGRNATEVHAGVLLGPTPSLRARRPTLDRRLAAVVQSCLERNRDDRFSCTRALAAALKPFGSAASNPARRDVAPARTVRTP